eukprot:977949_1
MSTSSYPGNRGDPQPSAGYPGRARAQPAVMHRAQPAVTQRAQPVVAPNPQQMNLLRYIWGISKKMACNSCLLIVFLIATVPIGFSVWLSTRAVLDDEYFQIDCIDPYDDGIAISAPNDLEFDVLLTCTIITTLVLMGVWWLTKRALILPCIYRTAGGVLIITAFASSALFIHVFWYLNELNLAFKESSPLDCYIDEHWETAYNDASAGLAVAICVFIFFCNVIYLAFELKESLVSGDLKLTQEQATLVSFDVIDKLGFSIATMWNRALLFRILKGIEPNGESALRDAIALSISKMISLKRILNELGVVGHRFIHIVLTDGVDNKSECSLDDIKGFYHKIGSNIGVTNFFKSYFIGIDLGPQEKRELQSIADLAGNTAELLNCDDAKKLSEIFSHITSSLGIERRVALNTEETNATGATEETFYLKRERQKFLVLFDLDAGASMSGNRWNSLLSALNLFFAKLDESDVIGCVLFNHEAICITGERLTTQMRILSAMTDPDVIRSVLFKK